VDVAQAILLGLVQGVTEFLPISSTAHLRILPALAGWPDPGAAFTAAIQLGTLAAVVIYFRKEITGALRGLLSSINGRGFDPVQARMGWAIVVGTIPIAVCGVAFQRQIETQLRSLSVVAWSLIGMGLVLLAAELRARRRRDEADVRPWDGLWVGLWQAAALVPGMSRSGSSIAGALFAGFDGAAAARISFLLSIPSVLAAGAFSLWKHRGSLLADEMLTPMLVANLASFLSGYAAIAFLIYFLRRHGTFLFVAYRLLLGALILAMLSNGRLEPFEGIPNEAHSRAVVSSR
jgi:undecaprenyl-diphosphatase